LSDNTDKENQMNSEKPISSTPAYNSNNTLKRHNRELKHDLFVALFSAFFATIIAAIASWFIVTHQINQSRLDNASSLKLEIIKEVTPLLLEVGYLHTFKVFISVEMAAGIIALNKKELEDGYPTLKVANKIRKKFPIEHQKSLDYDLRKTKVMAFLFLIQHNFGEEQRNAARVLVDIFDDEKLHKLVVSSWKTDTKPEELNPEIMMPYQQKIQSSTNTLLRLLSQEMDKSSNININ
jgi:hypothetical protein